MMTGARRKFPPRVVVCHGTSLRVTVGMDGGGVSGGFVIMVLCSKKGENVMK
jgi:hypothetical protein